MEEHLIRIRLDDETEGAIKFPDHATRSLSAFSAVLLTSRLLSSTPTSTPTSTPKNTTTTQLPASSNSAAVPQLALSYEDHEDHDVVKICSDACVDGYLCCGPPFPLLRVKRIFAPKSPEAEHSQASSMCTSAHASSESTPTQAQATTESTSTPPQAVPESSAPARATPESVPVVSEITTTVPAGTTGAELAAHAADTAAAAAKATLSAAAAGAATLSTPVDVASPSATLPAATQSRRASENAAASLSFSSTAPTLGPVERKARLASAGSASIASALSALSTPTHSLSSLAFSSGDLPSAFHSASTRTLHVSAPTTNASPSDSPTASAAPASSTAWSPALRTHDKQKTAQSTGAPMSAAPRTVTSSHRPSFAQPPPTRSSASLTTTNARSASAAFAPPAPVSAETSTPTTLSAPSSTDMPPVVARRLTPTHLTKEYRSDVPLPDRSLARVHSSAQSSSYGFHQRQKLRLPHQQEEQTSKPQNGWDLGWRSWRGGLSSGTPRLVERRRPRSAKLPPQREPQPSSANRRASRRVAKRMWVSRFVSPPDDYPEPYYAVPGEELVRTFRLRNEGSESWPPHTELVLVNTDPLPATLKVDAPVSTGATVQPEQEVTFTVRLRAHYSPIGSTMLYFRLQLNGPEGVHQFGQKLWSRIVVVQPV
eukprot:CAMPEP_0177634768 /NCGR_PEP_ID=MMETSP0447-20121125/3542_1 /TAXON_ID=0 /ORGANISM="Stygamoeba regulata, Strain BSH-02190019" /LENGTH=656 /DNA_ID=CAMNT_0019136507 /DNA_START=258 /DNA_END=2228 /DNA_ORIENTATION=+